MDSFCIAAFQCPSDAALAQQKLLACGLKVAMMPTPRDITASCGLSLRFGPADADRVTDVLGEMFPEREKCRCFDVCTEEGRRVFRPIAREERASGGQAPSAAKI